MFGFQVSEALQFTGLSKHEKGSGDLFQEKGCIGIHQNVHAQLHDLRIDKKDKKQLDHFLEYITSPHLVQDLPFGENCKAVHRVFASLQEACKLARCKAVHQK